MSSSDAKRFRVFVLGAGFSHAAGLPLGAELWNEVRHLARRRHGESNIIEHELEGYLEYLERTEGRAPVADEVDYEQFLGFLDLEHVLGFRGSKEDTSEGNGAQLTIKRLIGEVLVDRAPADATQIPHVYRDFASRLCTSDWVLSFNYDTLLEQALDAVGKPYRLFQNRMTYVNPKLGTGTADSSRDELVLLKLHGSIDWFDKTPYDEAKIAVSTAGVGLEPHGYGHFHPDSRLVLHPLLEGPQFPDDPMLSLYRMKNYREYYRQAYVPQAPFILAPSSAKLLYSGTLRPLWWGIGRAGGMNLGLSIIGYSVPYHDEHARRALYSLASNYTSFGPDFEIAGVRKLPLRIVNLASTPDAVDGFRKSYQFIDWQKAEVWLEGFTERALDFLFAE